MIVKCHEDLHDFENKKRLTQNIVLTTNIQFVKMLCKEYTIFPKRYETYHFVCLGSCAHNL